MNKIALLCLFFISLPAYCEVSVEVLCFTSDGGRPVRFEMRTYYDDQAKWSGGFVKYEKSKIAIPIVLSSSSEQSFDKNSPSLATSDWLEISDGKIAGEYEMVSQGASVSSMIYMNRNTKKPFYFSLDFNADSSVENGCRWKEK